MGYIDHHNRFSVEQAITVTVVGQNTYDSQALDSKVQDFVHKGDMFVVCKVHTTFTSGGAPTLVAAFQDSADNITFLDAGIKSNAVALATLEEGYMFRLGKTGPGLRRYWGMRYTVAGGAFTAGKVNAYLSESPQTNNAI